MMLLNLIMFWRMQNCPPVERGLPLFPAVQQKTQLF